MNTDSATNPLSAAVLDAVAHWRLIVAFPLLVGVLGVAFAKIIPKKFDGAAVFGPSQPEVTGVPASLRGLATQFGLPLPSAGFGVYYFAQVVQSREALRLVAVDTLSLDNQRLAVLDIVRAKGDSVAERIEDAIHNLTSSLTVRVDDRADLVTVTVRARTPALATALVAAFLDAVDVITMRTVNSGGSFEWRFAQAQADSARAALQRAEGSLRDFYVGNRSIAGSPTLLLEEARLQREIQVRRDVYLTLVQQAEAAKLQTARNTPTIAIVQGPQASIEKAWPKGSVWGAFGFLGSFTFALAWLYFVRPVILHALIASPGVSSPLRELARRATRVV